MKKLFLIAAALVSSASAASAADIWGADGSYQGWTSNGSVYGADGSYQGWISNSNPPSAIPNPPGTTSDGD